MQVIKELLGEERYYRLKRAININARKKWHKAMYRDIVKNKTVSLADKIWAYRHGFLSYRIAQFDLNEENMGKYLSDYDYAKLSPVNNMFKSWIDDKLTMKYILAPFDRFLPEYYFHITLRASGRVLKLMDCPAACTADINGIVSMLELRGILALKAVSGSHGDGFYKLAYSDGSYFINGCKSAKNILYELLGSCNDYIVTEYIEMHEDIKKLNSNSVNSIRLMVANEHGEDPFIGFAYLRVGTKRSGVVDNVSSGGLSCTIDLNTGEYRDAFIITEKNEIVFYNTHPDTGHNMEGSIPHWKMICENIIKICRYIGELEYMGFDIAVTPDGFKILEINSHLELPLFDFYNPDVRGYFSRLIKRKGIKTVNDF